MTASPRSTPSGTWSSRWVVGLVLFLASATSGSSSAAEVARLEIHEPQSYWPKGYISLVPAIHPPTTHDRGDLIQVWLKLPPGGEIDVQWLADQHRYTLLYPDGTRADRVEYFHVGEPASDLADYAPFGEDADEARARRWTVADVRGTWLTEGRQWFHVYRPAHGQPHAPLVGWRWPHGDPDARRQATERLLKHAGTHAGALADEPPGQAALDKLAQLNDCASCHIRNRPRIRLAAEDRAVERATDTLGFIVPNAVLQDDCVIADHRPEDLNVEDDFVTVYCANGRTAQLREDDNGYEWFACADGSQPRGHRDIAAGMAAGHPYTLAVCRSREALFRRMTSAARSAFADAFSVCGIDKN